MRHGRGLAAGALLIGCVTVATCVYPTEHDASVHVSLPPVRILFRGNDTVVAARAWEIRGPGDSQPIPNVAFVWSSSDSAVATVAAGRVVGIKSGTVIITAAARNFDTGQLAAADTIRVSAPLEIDSVRPRIVRYGELVSLYGVGVDSIFAAQLKSTPLILDPFADTAFANGTSRRLYWVPPPAQTDSLFFFGISGGNGVLGFVHGDTTRVIEHDLFEPDDTIPQPINLGAPPPFPAYPILRFFNPALAFEPLRRGEKNGVDWYHFTQAQTQDLTIILTAPQIAGTFSTFLTDSLGWNGPAKTYVIGSDSWTFGPKSHACHGAGFAPAEAVGDSTIVAFKNLPPPGLDAIAIYGTPGRYGLSVLAGYVSELPADAHEDDNSCNAADLRGTVPAPTFRDTLTIENPHDVDWIRFRYTSPGATSTAQVRLHAFPGTHPDSLKDLDLYVIKVPAATDTVVSVVAADTAAGSDVNLTPSLATGTITWRSWTSPARPPPTRSAWAPSRCCNQEPATPRPGRRHPPPRAPRSAAAARRPPAPGPPSSGAGGRDQRRARMLPLSHAGPGEQPVLLVVWRGHIRRGHRCEHQQRRRRSRAAAAHPRGQVPDRAPAGEGGHGPGVPGVRSHPRARGGYQGSSARCRPGRRGRAPLPAGGQDRRQARPPQHHPHLPGRERGRAQLLRDEVCRGHLARGPARQEGAAPGRRHPADSVGSRLRSEARPPERSRAPRRQARENHVRPRRPGHAHRLRHFQGAPGGDRVHGHRHDHRHAALHGARAGKGGGRGWPRRPVLAWRGRLSHDHGRAAVRRRLRPYHHLQAHLRGAAARERQAPRHPRGPHGRDLACPVQGPGPAVSDDGRLRHRRLAGAAGRVAWEGEGARHRAPASASNGRLADPDHRRTHDAAPGRAPRQGRSPRCS